MFDPSRCKLETWCGKGPKPDKYKRTGSRYDCLKVGYGIGSWQTKRKNIPDHDLDNIPYLTPTAKNTLINGGITSVSDFLNRIRSFQDYTATKSFLEEMGCFGTKKKFNLVILFLFERGIPITKLPECKE